MLALFFTRPKTKILSTLKNIIDFLIRTYFLLNYIHFQFIANLLQIYSKFIPNYLENKKNRQTKKKIVKQKKKIVKQKKKKKIVKQKKKENRQTKKKND